MKDLYRRNKLRPRETDRIKIHNSDGNEEDKEAAFTILLNAEKKVEYDRVHATLCTIGYVRRHLGLAGKSNWRIRYGDFLHPPDPPGKPKKPRRKKSRYEKPPRKFPALPRLRKKLQSLVNWPLALLVAVSLLPLIYLASVSGSGGTAAQSFDQKVYTLNPSVPVFASPDITSARLSELTEFEDLSIDPRRSTTRWAYAKLNNDSAGYVQQKHLARGSGEAAQVAKCREYGEWRPDSGQHLASGKTGVHKLEVVNLTKRDALVKLKDHGGDTQVFFYVREAETVTVNTIPEGRFQIQYALGENYSPACARFLDDMEAMRDPQFMTFSARRQSLGGASIAKLTLKPEGDRLRKIRNREF